MLKLFVFFWNSSTQSKWCKYFQLPPVLKWKQIMSTKVRIVKATVFPVVMNRCESWTIKKAECQRIDAFEWWYWRRLLRVSWIARRSNQSILKKINLEYSMEGDYLSEGLMLKLTLQYFGHLMWRADLLQKTLKLGKTEGKEEGGSRGRNG